MRRFRGASRGTAVRIRSGTWTSAAVTCGRSRSTTWDSTFREAADQRVADRVCVCVAMCIRVSVYVRFGQTKIRAACICIYCVHTQN